MLDNMIVDTISSIGQGYISTFAYDCQSDVVKNLKSDGSAVINFTEVCADKPDKNYMPSFQIHKPAEIKINPYTGKEMPSSMVGFPGKSLDPK